MSVKNMLRSAAGLALAAAAAAHVSMSSPCVRYTPFCSSCPALPAGAALDHDINAPIGTHETVKQPMCKYATPYATPAVEWMAGTTVTVKFREHAAVHGGGHCQFALSYDGGATFVVVHDELRYCFVGGPSASNAASQLSYSFMLPAGLPAGDKVVFAWAWNNAIGNREFYMNCADVAIRGTGTSFSGPELLVANYGPKTPFIPEFNGNYETGIDLYHARKVVTVTGAGLANGTAAPYNAAYAPAPVVLPEPVVPAPMPLPVDVPAVPAYGGAPVLPPVDIIPTSSALALPMVPPTPVAYALSYMGSRAPAPVVLPKCI
ncbi:hypothetical protein IWQ57_004434 [Coemansia nantahalensis]|uniref:Uncharacterized protein n=1 Tax=Coemansia nantahalensis TaxID=2789366 RepID=A0ACC1JRX1_9FUNG|nr:hypothetical protein IWQ57_004434 [Coemansia nantahalensis]